MRLDQALVARDLCESRNEAQGIIENGNVLVNGTVVTKQTKPVADTDSIEVTARRKYVSRGGEKLEGVLLDTFFTDDKVKEFCFGKVCLDAGSSTGGFTDCLLSYGAAHIDAVDVGTLQLHEKLRKDERVSLYENTDIRDFKEDKKYDIIVADLSFIPLQHVFQDLLRFGKEGSYYFLLIKPQFEAGKGNTKKGIVKDKEIIEKILSEYLSLSIEFGMKDVKVIPCRIQGGEGNQEYFLYAKKGKERK